MTDTMTIHISSPHHYHDRHYDILTDSYANATARFLLIR